MIIETLLVIAAVWFAGGLYTHGAALEECRQAYAWKKHTSSEYLDWWDSQFTEMCEHELPHFRLLFLWPLFLGRKGYADTHGNP